MGSTASIFTKKEVIKKPAKVAGFLIQKKHSAVVYSFHANAL